MGARAEPVGDDDPTALLIAPSQGADQTVVGPTTGARAEVTETIDDPRLVARAQARPAARSEATEVLGVVRAPPEGAQARTESALRKAPEGTASALPRPEEGTLALTESALLAPGPEEETLALSDSRFVARRRAEETQTRTQVRPPALTRLRTSMRGTLLWINVVCGVLILVGLAVLLWRS